MLANRLLTIVLWSLFSITDMPVSAQDNGVCYKRLDEIVRELPIEKMFQHVYYGKTLDNWQDYGNIEYVKTFPGTDSFYACSYLGDRLYKEKTGPTSYSIFCTQIWEADTVAIYMFGQNSTHNYYYMLLKNKTHYTILNCHNFMEEWKSINALINKTTVKPNYSTISMIINCFINNSDTHPGVPMPVSRDSISGKIEMEFLPRKLYHTAPFYYPE